MNIIGILEESDNELERDDEIEFLKGQLEIKAKHEMLLIKVLCNVILYILISITVISCVAVACYFFSPQTYDEYNNNSKNNVKSSLKGGENK